MLKVMEYCSNYFIHQAHIEQTKLMADSTVSLAYKIN